MELSEEENIAIETLKEVASDDFDTLGDDISPKMARNILNLIEKQQKENQGLFELYNFNDSSLLSKILKDYKKIIEKQQKEIEELKKENKEIRDWKYVIDNPIDLDKLKELDIIKIKGKEYISKSIYNELEKDKKALVNNYSNVLGEFIPKDKIREKIKDYTEKSKHPLVNSQSRREYTFGLKALKELLEED